MLVRSWFSWLKLSDSLSDFNNHFKGHMFNQRVPGCPVSQVPRLGATNKWGTKGSSVQCCEICPRNKYELQKASLDLRLGIVKYKMVGASTKYCTLHDTATWYHPKLPVLSPPPNSTKHKTHLTAPRPKVGPPHDVPVPSSNPSTNFCPTEAPMFIHGHQSSTPKKNYKTSVAVVTWW